MRPNQWDANKLVAVALISLLITAVIIRILILIILHR